MIVHVAKTITMTSFAILCTGEGGALMYIVVSRRAQENTVKGLFFEIKRCTHAAHLGVQNRQFSTKRVLFSKSFRFSLLVL